jgi:hypothetical protein
MKASVSYRQKQNDSHNTHKTVRRGKIRVLVKGGGNTLHAPDPPPDPVRSAPLL